LKQMRKWLRQQSKDFRSVGFDALVKQCDKCINVGGGYIQFRISHVLRSVFICDLFSDSP
jgi:hypothetical protein